MVPTIGLPHEMTGKSVKFETQGQEYSANQDQLHNMISTKISTILQIQGFNHNNHDSKTSDEHHNAHDRKAP
jgi:hypothetical protein